MFLLLFVISCASVRFTEYMNRRICIERLVPCLIISIPFFIILKLRWLHERITTAMVLSLFYLKNILARGFLLHLRYIRIRCRVTLSMRIFKLGGGRSRSGSVRKKRFGKKKGWGGRIAAKDIGHHPLSLFSMYRSVRTGEMCPLRPLLFPSCLPTSSPNMFRVPFSPSSVLA